MKQKLKTTIVIMSMLFILFLATPLRFATVEPEHGQVSAVGASIALIRQIKQMRKDNLIAVSDKRDPNHFLRDKGFGSVFRTIMCSMKRWSAMKKVCVM